jgi:hypothetical protein
LILLSVYLSNDHPLAVDSRLYLIDLDGGLSKGDVNIFQKLGATGVVRKDREIQALPSIVEFAILELHFVHLTASINTSRKINASTVAMAMRIIPGTASLSFSSEKGLRLEGRRFVC